MIKYLPRKLEILTAMAQQGLNQKTLGEKAEINKATISLFLNGKRTISASTAKKLAKALNAEVEKLFNFEITEVAQEV